MPASLGFTWVRSRRDTEPAYDCLCLLSVYMVCMNVAFPYFYGYFFFLLSRGVLYLLLFHMSLSILG